ncbi:hypothetical protein V6N12_073987 [Hibiscus sabdariffa]|uniref:Uncharacterized protein n=1 Tax=Hibiscus sabdariffa TaxID=183260 RepID=A0ABR1ZY91_9ROSI
MEKNGSDFLSMALFNDQPPTLSIHLPDCPLSSPSVSSSVRCENIDDCYPYHSPKMVETGDLGSELLLEEM